jgi:hypothetical protein
MMASVGATVDMPALMHQMTMSVKVVGLREFALRLRVALWLLTAAAWVIGCGIKIDVEHDA